MARPFLATWLPRPPIARGPLREVSDYKNCVRETEESGQRAMVTLIARAEAGETFKPGERIAVGS